jgi:hypothetical protein
MTDWVQLQKLLPPPVPVGPDEAAPPVDAPALVGVQARVLVDGAPDLSSAEQAMLASAPSPSSGTKSLIILRWGWHQQQRDQDPYTNEFRVYESHEDLDITSGTLTDVVPSASAGIYDVKLALDRAISSGAASDLYLQAGYPFYVLDHNAGSTIDATVKALVPGTDGKLPVPALGPILLPLHWSADRTRPPAWPKRIQVLPLPGTTPPIEQFQTTIVNPFLLTPDHPRDRFWVGVSAADDQPYVPDQFPGGGRPGNESAIVPVICHGHYYGRPEFKLPLALEHVDEIRAPEPSTRPIYFSLDLTPYLAWTGLAAADLVRPERASAAAVLAAYSASTTTPYEFTAHDPEGQSADASIDLSGLVSADQQSISKLLNGTYSGNRVNDYVVFLAAKHPYGDRLFAPVMQDPVAFGPFQDTLPPKADRFVYRIRKADAAGHLSADSAMARVAVRVPSMATGPVPVRVPPTSPWPAGHQVLQFVVPNAQSSTVTSLLTFSQTAAASATGPVPTEAAELVRMPNTTAASGILLRAPDDTLLAPKVTVLTAADLVDGDWSVALFFSGPSGTRLRVWACSLTSDGIPSALAGPWSLVFPLLPPPPPTLVVAKKGPGATLTFAWSWPGLAVPPVGGVSLWRSADGKTWERISPPITALTAFIYDPPALPAGVGWQYQVQFTGTDGRSSTSNNVTP